MDLAENAVLSFYEWAGGHKVRAVKNEWALVSDKMRFGGTLDCLCELDGEMELLDFKTGKAIYDEHFVQLAAYRKLAEEHGFLFVGGHPMAGTHFSGFKYSRATLFKGAPMVLVPPVFDDMQLIDRVCKLLAPPAFGQFSVTTAEKHDEMIAFTSQLAHVVSNAYVKSPTAAAHKGFSAGSYKDLTRVAWLNPEMWTELFLENKDNLTREIDILIGELQQYRDAMAADDRETLCRLLDEGKKRKEEVG